eukprot:c12388_g1_i1 orf=432-1550(-)
MYPWKSLLVLVLFCSLGCSIVQARKVLIYSRGRSPANSWFTVKVTEADVEREKGLSRLWGSLRLPFEEIPISRPNFEKRLLPLFPGFYSQRRQPFDGVSQSFICRTCLNISTQSEQALSDPDILKQMVEFLNSTICGLFMPELGEQCMDLATAYAPDMIQWLREVLTPEHLCVDTKLCPSLSVLFLDDDRVCAMCEEFAADALGYLSENSTEAEAMSALHHACSKLGELSFKCKMLVDAYGPTLVGKLQLLTPQEVCHKVKLCSAVSSQRKSYCATCVHTVDEMRAQMRNPLIQEKMIEVLSHECMKIPTYANQCKEIIAQYGTFILARLDSLLNAGMVCTKIHACEFVPAPSLTPAFRTTGSKTIETIQEM